MDDLLLTALARALAAWGGARRWRVLLESHGRQPMWKGADVTRTVGWFTARYPVLLDLEGAEDAGLQIKRVKEMLRQVPRGGGGYEAARQHAAGEPLPAITFNYLGQLGGDLRADGWAWVDEDAGSVVAPEARLVHDLEIMGFVAAGRLRLAIAYGRGRISDAAIERLAAGLEREITHVVEHASGQKGRSLTPSDIDYDGFDIEALDAFVNDLQERR
jgi:non-ribosomal peptide synthase protein (TIGR01720 family)